MDSTSRFREGGRRRRAPPFWNSKEGLQTGPSKNFRACGARGSRCAPPFPQILDPPLDRRLGPYIWTYMKPREMGSCVFNNSRSFQMISSVFNNSWSFQMISRVFNNSWSFQMISRVFNHSRSFQMIYSVFNNSWSFQMISRVFNHSRSFQMISRVSNNSWSFQMISCVFNNYPSFQRFLVFSIIIDVFKSMFHDFMFNCVRSTHGYIFSPSFLLLRKHKPIVLSTWQTES